MKEPERFEGEKQFSFFTLRCLPFVKFKCEQFELILFSIYAVRSLAGNISIEFQRPNEWQRSVRMSLEFNKEKIIANEKEATIRSSKERNQIFVLNSHNTSSND